MRFGFAYDSAYPWFNGGIERRRYLIMEELVRGGHSVHLFTMFREGMPSEEFTYRGVHYHCVGKAMPSEKMYVKGRRNIAWAIKYAALLDLKIWGYRFDVVDTDAFPFLHVPKLAAYSKLTGAKFIVTWHEVWDRRYWKEYLKGMGELGYAAQKVAAYYGNIIANVEQTKQMLVKILKVNPKRITVFPAAISAREIDSFIRKNRRKPSDYFVASGRLVPEKRIDLAIRAVAATKSRLLIIGKGPQKPMLIKLARELGISKRVKFMEGVKENEFMMIIYNARALLMFSQREGMSMVTIEALAFGTPVIISNETSLPKEIAEYCHKVDSKETAVAISRLLNNKGSVLYRPNTHKKRIMEKFCAEKGEEIYRKISSA